MSWSIDQPTLVSLLQVTLDILILLAISLFFLFLGKRQKLPAGTEELLHNLEKILEETRKIGKEFDTNLQERQDLIRQILARLDQKIEEAEKLCDRMEGLGKAQAAAPVEDQAAMPSQSDHRKVLLLSKKGMDPKAIAKRLQRPIGEVELILDIQRLSQDR